MVVSAQNVVDALSQLTAKTQSAQNPANQISIINVALAVSGLGPIPVIVARLNDIVAFCNDFISNTVGTKPFTEKSDQDAIVKILITHTQVGQSLLNILIGKAGLVPNLVPFVGPPITQALRQYESSIDSLLFELVDIAPNVADTITAQKIRTTPQ